MTQPHAPTAGAVRKITANLIVDAIEPVLPFWVDRLGFTRAANGLRVFGEIHGGATQGLVTFAGNTAGGLIQVVHDPARALPAAARGLVNSLDRGLQMSGQEARTIVVGGATRLGGDLASGNPARVRTAAL